MKKSVGISSLPKKSNVMENSCFCVCLFTHVRAIMKWENNVNKCTNLVSRKNKRDSWIYFSLASCISKYVFTSKQIKQLLLRKGFKILFARHTEREIPLMFSFVETWLPHASRITSYHLFSVCLHYGFGKTPREKPLGKKP